MEQLKINRTLLATRCDICHQSDCYDPYQDRCERCQPLYYRKPIIRKIKKNWKITPESTPANLITYHGILVNIFAIVLGLATGVVSILSWMAMPLVWLGGCVSFSLVFYVMKERHHYFTGLVFNASVSLGVLMIVIKMNERLGQPYSLSDNEISSIVMIGLIGTLLTFFIIWLMDRLKRSNDKRKQFLSRKGPRNLLDQYN